MRGRLFSRICPRSIRQAHAGEGLRIVYLLQTLFEVGWIADRLVQQLMELLLLGWREVSQRRTSHELSHELTTSLDTVGRQDQRLYAAVRGVHSAPEHFLAFQPIGHKGERGRIDMQL
jgi:hypothetical protein